MPSILNLKFKGNKSFVAFSNLGDAESLTKTWKVCTKVASFLEQGQRLENLSWRLWHLQNLMVDTDNAKSKREFKKLSKCMGDKLDKEKGRSIEELEAPDFKRNHSTEMIRQRAAEKERSREASQNAKPGTIKRMQFTFSVDQPTPAGNYPVKKPDLKPSPEFNKRPRNAATAAHHAPAAPPAPAHHAQESRSNDMVVVNDEANDKDPPKQFQRPRKSAQHALNTNTTPTISNANTPQASLRFPPVFSSDFGPSALLFPTPTLTTRMNYGEGLNPSSSSDVFSVARPTIELPLDELLNNVESADSPDWFSHHAQLNPIDLRAMEEPHQLLYPEDESHQSSPEQPQQQPQPQIQTQDITMQPINELQNTPIVQSMPQPTSSVISEDVTHQNQHNQIETENSRRVTMNTNLVNSPVNAVPPVSQAVKETLPQTVAPSKINSYGTRSSTPIGRPSLTVRTQAPPTTRSSGPGATATSLNPAVLRHNNGNNAPGGVKAECSNCGATHTPLWRRGLNDELNCNACGLYCKLHKRPRPKSMRNAHGEGRTQVAPRQETVDVMAQCYNCHTTATPLWRKDDEGKTVCNACGLYYKLHGSARPISMKSDVIRKRSRHDARRMGNGAPDTPSASPGVSRRASPTREASPTLAPDSSTAQITYEYNEEMDYRSSQSELLSALGQEHLPNPPYSLTGQFPGPYHPDYIYQMQNAAASDAHAFASSENSDLDLSMSPRATKRRRMSTDSSSEPPSSAVSYSSFNDGYSSASSATSVSQRSTSEYPFGSPYPSSTSSSPFSNTVALRGSGNTFWHPPMMPQGDRSPHLVHPPMLPPEDTPMDYLHPPMLQHDDDSLFSAFIHPPMALPEAAAADSGSNHPPMFANEFAHHDSYDTSMRVY
ncbi:hypothetical protein AX16_004938 [Volvariella volvacea WC 439]|nr:hypothetical protein AX16_004938 [Volvariella volvacea WC 439]